MPCGTTVEELCGQPEQKYGVRADTSVMAATALCACFSRDTRFASSSTWPRRSTRSPIATATLFGSSAPFTGNSHSPSSSLADHHRLVRGAVQLLAHLHLDQRALLLDHDDEVEPSANFFSSACDSGQGHATL